MKTQDYQKTITVRTSPKETFENITNVAGWWTSHFKGNTVKLDATFKLRFGDNWFSFKVVESIPGEKLVWLVTDCYMDWIKDKDEWKGTKIVWVLSEDKNGTRIEMTHVGLVPSVECYKTCNLGWNNYIGKSLLKLIETGNGELFDD